ncbi:hypothetical protein NEOLI_001019 [Neolecta irregularis DAH-3]|uniref:Uncharacterized protein n=1 Tax=Neolecta irregularis (strain DAH-3) TaxID=1198029 RepID=A0A1U7LGX6_NEOID|nr:hypothetical protein NEOLI_001019 [Neolecta irregularis DAH-3]|eukprot:OLL21802.1 hypothetical protein NEOLI_001019 [Neolecta irregularis DAH-3]
MLSAPFIVLLGLVAALPVLDPENIQSPDALKDTQNTPTTTEMPPQMTGAMTSTQILEDSFPNQKSPSAWKTPDSQSTIKEPNTRVILPKFVYAPNYKTPNTRAIGLQVVSATNPKAFYYPSDPYGYHNSGRQITEEYVPKPHPDYKAPDYEQYHAEENMGKDFDNGNCVDNPPLSDNDIKPFDDDNCAKITLLSEAEQVEMANKVLADRQARKKEFDEAKNDKEKRLIVAKALDACAELKGWVVKACAATVYDYASDYIPNLDVVTTYVSPFAAVAGAVISNEVDDRLQNYARTAVDLEGSDATITDILTAKLSRPNKASSGESSEKTEKEQGSDKKPSSSGESSKKTEKEQDSVKKPSSSGESSKKTEKEQDPGKKQ